MQKELELNGDCRKFLISRRGDSHKVTVGEASHDATLRQTQGAEHILTIGGTPHRVRLASNGDDVFVHYDGVTHKLTLTDPLLRAATDTANASDTVTAPMPGTVVSINVPLGDKIAKGATLMVIESMKLQTTISAWRDGVVAEINLTEGDTFDRGAALISLEPEEN